MVRLKQIFVQILVFRARDVAPRDVQHSKRQNPIVRKPEQAEILRGLGAQHVVDSSTSDFMAQLRGAIEEAQGDEERPTLIDVKSIIGFPSPDQGTADVHGKALGECFIDEVAAAVGDINDEAKIIARDGKPAGDGPTVQDPKGAKKA